MVSIKLILLAFVFVLLGLCQAAPLNENTRVKRQWGRPGFGPGFGGRPGFGPGPSYGGRPGVGPGFGRPGFGGGPTKTVITKTVISRGGFGK